MERYEKDLHLLEVAGRGLRDPSCVPSEKDVLGRDAVIPIDDESPERRPVARFVAGLLQELAFCGGEWMLVVFYLALRHRGGAPTRSDPVRSAQYEPGTPRHLRYPGQIVPSCCD